MIPSELMFPKINSVAIITALSPFRQLAALTRIHELVEGGCQLIIATHSPILMAYPCAKILQFSENGIHKIAYEDTEHFQVTKDFLNRREVMLDELLS